MNTEITTTGQDIMNTSIGEGQFLTFELNNEMYGVDILKVQEIRGWTEVTNIPNAPHFIPASPLFVHFFFC